MGDVDEQWRGYPRDYERLAAEPRSCFRCLGFLLKYEILVKTTTNTDIVSRGAMYDEGRLYGLAEAVYGITSAIVCGVPDRTSSALPKDA